MCGFIEKNGTNGKYRLGKKLLTLSNVLYSTDQTKAIIKPYMDKIAEECQETVYFAVPSGSEIIYVEGSYPSGMLYARSIAGVKSEMYCTGVGKAILAHSGDELFQEVVRKGFKAYTSFTLVNEIALKNDLESTRKRGYAIDNMEHEYGIRCVSVPVHNSHGNLIGALSISGPSLRVMDDKVVFFVQKLKEAVAELRNILN
jgi:DNA-binding IclR family transcriptional regulator